MAFSNLMNTLAGWPIWATVITGVAILILGAAFRTGARVATNRNQPGLAKRRKIISVIAFILAIILLAQLVLTILAHCGVGTARATEPAPTETPAATAPAPASNDSTPQPEAPAEPAWVFDPEDFWAKLEREDVSTFLSTVKVAMTFEELQRSWYKGTLPASRVDRIEFDHAQMRKYIDPELEAVHDVVDYAMEELLAQFYSEDWAKLSTEEKETVIWEYFVPHFVIKLATDPLHRHQAIQVMKDLAEEHPEILEGDNADWAPAMIAEDDFAFSGSITSGKRGVYYFLEDPESLEDEAVLTEQYVLDALRVAQFFLNGFGLANPGISAQTTTVNFSMNMAVKANDANIVRHDKPDEQESLPSVILVHNQKNFGTVYKIGVNLFDWRMCEYDPQVPTPEPPAPPAPGPEPEPPQPEPQPQPQPQPVIYSTSYRHLDESGARLRDDYVSSGVAGSARSYSAPAIDGYEFNRSSAQLGTPQPAKNEVIDLIYGKVVQRPTTYTTTYRHLDEDGKRLRDDYVFSGAAGAARPYTAPAISGYTFNRSSAQLGTPQPDRNEVIDLIYRQNQQPSAESAQLVIYYKYSRTGQEAAPTYRADVLIGKTFSVTSPRASDGVSKPDIPVVSGTMVKGGVTKTVWYDKETDGNGDKNSAASNGEQNPTHPNGDLNPTDGTDTYQQAEPPAEDNRGTTGGNTTGNTTVSATDPGRGESSGLGGEDKPVTGPGKVDNGTPPATPDNSTTAAAASATSTETNPTGGTTTNTTPTSNQGVRTTTVSDED